MLSEWVLVMEQTDGCRVDVQAPGFSLVLGVLHRHGLAVHSWEGGRAALTGWLLGGGVWEDLLLRPSEDTAVGHPWPLDLVPDHWPFVPGDIA